MGWLDRSIEPRARVGRARLHSSHTRSLLLLWSRQQQPRATSRRRLGPFGPFAAPFCCCSRSAFVGPRPPAAAWRCCFCCCLLLLSTIECALVCAETSQAQKRERETNAMGRRGGSRGALYRVASSNREHRHTHLLLFVVCCCLLREGTRALARSFIRLHARASERAIARACGRACGGLSLVVRWREARVLTNPTKLTDRPTAGGIGTRLDSRVVARAHGQGDRQELECDR